VASRSAMLRWVRLRQRGYLAGDVVGDAADREVRVDVRDDTLASALGSSSRARNAALIPASLPPIMTRCMLALIQAGLLSEAGCGRLTGPGMAMRRRPLLDRGTVQPCCGGGGR
jgi:hypothetical protein